MTAENVVEAEKKKRILFVDDDSDTRVALCRILNVSGFDVVAAGSFDQALEFAVADRFDLYLLDNWLRDRSGLDLCREIRSFDTRTPIVFYSAAAYESDKTQAFDAGAQRYITKPANIEEIEAVILSLTAAQK